MVGIRRSSASNPGTAILNPRLGEGKSKIVSFETVTFVTNSYGEQRRTTR